MIFKYSYNLLILLNLLSGYVSGKSKFIYSDIISEIIFTKNQ